jgi:DMSO/TMAO reductase YedYZ heme-binding membrane subunit
MTNPTNRSACWREGICETTLAIFAVLLGLVHDLATGLGHWLDKPTTNASVLLVFIFTSLFLVRSFETRIDRLRDLINAIENRRSGNWP